MILNATGTHGNNAPKHIYSTAIFFSSLSSTFIFIYFCLCLSQRLLFLVLVNKMIFIFLTVHGSGYDLVFYFIFPCHSSPTLSFKIFFVFLSPVTRLFCLSRCLSASMASKGLYFSLFAPALLQNAD